eukprot:10415977-Prorocentrum_lima.AAC.1
MDHRLLFRDCIRGVQVLPRLSAPSVVELHVVLLEVPEREVVAVSKPLLERRDERDPRPEPVVDL